MKQPKLLLVFSLLLILLTPSFPGYSDDAGPIVYFGFIPRYNPMVMYRSYQPMMDYLSANTPYRFELKLSRDYHQAVEFLRDGATPVASLGDTSFVAAHQSFGVIPLAKPLNREGTAYYRGAFVVRDDSDIKSLHDLKGKRFAFGNHHSTTGNLVPYHHLEQEGIRLADLGSYAHLPSHDAVAKAVLKGQVDAGAVKDVVALRYHVNGLRVLSFSDPIPSPPIVAAPGTAPELIAALTTALLAINPGDPETASQLSQWDPEFAHGFVPADAQDYQIIFDLVQHRITGCGLSCH